LPRPSPAPPSLWCAAASAADVASISSFNAGSSFSAGSAALGASAGAGAAASGAGAACERAREIGSQSDTVFEEGERDKWEWGGDQNRHGKNDSVGVHVCKKAADRRQTHGRNDCTRSARLCNLLLLGLGSICGRVSLLLRSRGGSGSVSRGGGLCTRK
jgi:hypothetical protein